MPLYQLRELADNNETSAIQAGHAASLSCNVHSLMAWDWRAGMSIPQRAAEDHLIIFMESGKLSATINNSTYSAARQQCLWIPKHASRSLQAESDSQFIACHLDITPQHLVCELQAHVSVLNRHYLAQLKRYLKSTKNKSVYLQLTNNIFTSFLQDAIFNTVLQVNEHEDPLIATALALLDQQPQLSAEQCAQHVGLGITRFRQRFRHCCGTSPGKFITKLRCQKAASMLRNTQDTIADISLACGYENPNYLYRVFKENYHCTPQAYREGINTQIV